MKAGTSGTSGRRIIEAGGIGAFSAGGQNAAVTSVRWPGVMDCSPSAVHSVESFLLSLKAMGATASAVSQRQFTMETNLSGTPFYQVRPGPSPRMKRRLPIPM